MRKIVECIKKFFSNKTNIFLLSFIILNALSTITAFAKTGHKDSIITLVLVMIAELILEIGAILLYYRLSKHGASPEKKFLAFVIPIGIIFTFLLPIGQAPDEYIHIARAYAISNGELIAKTNDSNRAVTELPVELMDYAGFNNNHNYSDTINKISVQLSGDTYADDENYPAASSYNPIVYIPHVLGILIGKLLHLPLLFTLYLGRILGFTTFIALAYFAIKIIPKFKKFLIFITLLPMTIQQAISFSADTITMGLAFLVIAYAIHLAYDQKVKKISNKQKAIAITLAILISVCKIAYSPLCLLFLLIPCQKFSTKKRKYLDIAIMTFTTGILAFAWMKIQPTAPAESNDQLANILSNPILYFARVFNTVANYNTIFYISSTFGLSLGLLHIDLPVIYLFITLIMLVFILQDRESVPMRTIDRLYFWGSFIVIFGGIMTALYLSWSEYDSPIVEGVQGRYFIPILPLLPFMIYSKKHGIKESQPLDMKYVYLFGAFFNICAFVYIFAYTF